MMSQAQARWSDPGALPLCIPAVVDRHCSEAAFLYTLRRHCLRRADVTLADVSALDERCEAHLDGIRIAHERGWQAATRALANAGIGEVFACATLAVESGNWGRISPLLAAVEAQAWLWPGLVGAFGWASPFELKGTVKSLLASESAFYRRLGLAACAVQRVDPARPLLDGIADPDDALREQALRTAGELGLVGLLPLCLAGLDDLNIGCRFWAAWSAVLLGDRENALETLFDLGLSAQALDARSRRLALRLSLEAGSLDRGHDALRALSHDASARRLVVEGMGWLGSTRHVPWLIEQMGEARLARAAGEAFSRLTGASPGQGSAPVHDVSAPDPVDQQVEDVEGGEFADADQGLPWPDCARAKSWWTANGAELPEGRRCFLGATPSAGRCAVILANASQRQRTAAAEHICLERPGSILFNVRAPAWRQHRALAASDAANACPSAWI